MNRIPELLVVDDEEADVGIIRAVTRRSPVEMNIRAFTNSEELVNALESEESPVPDLLLLDLNLPGRDGKELLRRIRRSPRWRSSIVVMFSGSDLEQDVLDCYELGANAYVIKPADLEGYRKTFDAIVSFWLDTARRVTRTNRPN